MDGKVHWTWLVIFGAGVAFIVWRALKMKDSDSTSTSTTTQTTAGPDDNKGPIPPTIIPPTPPPDNTKPPPDKPPADKTPPSADKDFLKLRNKRPAAATVGPGSGHLGIFLQQKL